MITFKKILFCNDFSESAKWAFPYALELAKLHDGKIYILHIVPETDRYLFGYSLPEDLKNQIEQEQKKKIEEGFKETCIEQMGDFKNYGFIVKEGDVPFIEILEFAKENDVDIIVMGTHGRTGLNHVLFGSTAENVVRKSSCPVLTVRHPERKLKL